MKIAAIDVGSNSVRLMVMADGKTLYKRLCTTRLGEGVAVSGTLSPVAIERTAQAVSEFVNYAKTQEKAERVLIFATAAVRSSSNGKEFTNRVYSLCGEEVDVVSGEEEAALGILGALRGQDGGIIDLGGASTEISLQKGGKKVYGKSVNVGTVRLFDLCGQDRLKLQKVIEELLKDYGTLSLNGYDIYAIGGTATSLAAIKHRLKVYDPAVVNGTVLTEEELKNMADELLSLTVEQRKAIEGLDVRRADVIAGGCLLMYNIVKCFNAQKIIVSESDNLEGYAMLKGYAK
ncbi:MAG: hypothetical protein LUD19_00525 [Clostridia bacterium]|nr:hypothetical protein [Clostridia bacterium]